MSSIIRSSMAICDKHLRATGLIDLSDRVKGIYHCWICDAPTSRVVDLEEHRDVIISLLCPTVEK